MSEYLTGIAIFILVLSPLCIPIAVTIADVIINRRHSRRKRVRTATQHATAPTSTTTMAQSAQMDTAPLGRRQAA
jgi:hypothetical protein